MKLKAELIPKLNVYLMLSMLTPFIFMLGLIFVHFLRKGRLFVSFSISVLPFFLILVFLLLVAFSRGNEDLLILHHARDFIMFVVVSFYLTVVCQKEKRGAVVVYNSIKNMYLLMAVIKILILIYAFIFSVPMGDLLDFISDNTGIPMMQTTTLNDYLFRLQFPLDPVIPLLLFFLVKEYKYTQNKNIILFQFFLLVFSLIITMSRAFWLIGFILVFISFYFEYDLYKKIKLVMAGVLVGFLLIFTTNVYQYVFDIVGSRIGKEAESANYYSDLERNIQYDAIINAFYENPFWGKGLGYYIPNVIRDKEDKYLYEIQTLSYLMDFGLIISIILLLLLLFHVFKNNNDGMFNIILAMVFFVIWLFFGSVNPLLMGMTGAFVIFFSLNFRVLNSMYGRVKLEVRHKPPN